MRSLSYSVQMSMVKGGKTSRGYAEPDSFCAIEYGKKRKNIQKTCGV